MRVAWMYDRIEEVLKFWWEFFCYSFIFMTIMMTMNFRMMKSAAWGKEHFAHKEATLPFIVVKERDELWWYCFLHPRYDSIHQKVGQSRSLWCNWISLPHCLSRRWGSGSGLCVCCPQDIISISSAPHVILVFDRRCSPLVWCVGDDGLDAGYANFLSSPFDYSVMPTCRSSG